LLRRTVGRWISPDPIAEAGGINLYGFVRNSPPNYFDPTGEFTAAFGEAWIGEVHAGRDVLWSQGTGWGAIAWNTAWGSFASLGEGIPDVLRFGDALGGVSADPCARWNNWLAAIAQDASRGASLASTAAGTAARGMAALRASRTGDTVQGIQALTGPFKGPYSRGLPAGTLDDVAARNWYLGQLDAIPGKINGTQSLRNQARQAFELRNQARIDARALMSNRKKALEYDITDPIPTWQDQVRHSYAKGNRGSAIWEDILESSMRSRASVNSALGLAR
jgi:hypothetical protein